MESNVANSTRANPSFSSFHCRDCQEEFNVDGKRVTKNSRSITLNKKNSKGRVYVNIRNTTSFTEDQISEMLTSALPGVVPDFDLTVSNRHTDRYHGTCYPYGCNLRKDPDKPLIIARVTADDTAFPMWTVDPGIADQDEEDLGLRRLAAEGSRRLRRRGYIRTLLRSRQECLLYILAHELKHLKQRDSKSGWIWGSRGKRYSERDADAFAIRVVRAWRRRKVAHEAEMALQRAGSFLSLRLANLTIAILGRCLH